jgi:hypothetical protein
MARHPSSKGVPGVKSSGERATTWRQKKLSSGGSGPSPSRVNIPLTT